MTEQERLEALKIDLGITTEAFDERLKQYLSTGQQLIQTEGITLDLEDVTDNQLIVMYAGWLWRKRDYQFRNDRNEREIMPRMLRYALNNRLMAEKGHTDG